MDTPPASLANLRDVGTAHPALRRGVLLRGDTPHADDVHIYDVEWPPRTVVDLRSPSERDDTHPLAGFAQIFETPLVGDVVVESTDPITLDDLYLAFISPPGSRFLVEAIETIATAPAPVFVHCAAGKDRTGVLIAIILRLLALPHDEIALDYSLSENAMPQILSRWQARRRRMNRPDDLPEVDPSHLRATQATMRTFLAALDNHDGGARGWFLAAGGTTHTLGMLRDRFLASERADEAAPATIPVAAASPKTPDVSPKAHAVPSAQNDPPAPPPAHTIPYGGAPLQSLDLWTASTAESAPLLIFVHSGGFQQGDKSDAINQWMVEHSRREGYGFASINYRLVPDATVEQATQDVASAAALFVGHAAERGVDRERIVLIGHGAGGTLVSLVGTDERYLNAAGLTFSDIAGIVTIDCALFDIPSRMLDDGPPLMHEMYQAAFGTDALRQRALSSTLHATGPNVDHFLLVSTQDTPGETQAHGFAQALASGGTNVQLHTFAAGEGLQGHDEIVRRLGDPSSPQTPVVDAWLKTLFAK